MGRKGEGLEGEEGGAANHKKKEEEREETEDERRNQHACERPVSEDPEGETVGTVPIEENNSHNIDKTKHNSTDGSQEDNHTLSGMDEATTEDVGDGGGEGGSGRCHCCSETLQVYASHFLSSWGDRMWMFAGGLFLLEVTPGSLRLAAVYGAALALTVIILGAPVGRWVDRTSRLTAAQVSLIVQNVMVCVCAGLLVAITTYPQAFTAWDGWALVVAEAGVILTACMAQVGTLGSRLAIEKDWILVICGKDKTKLAKMNSVLRTVDLSTEVFAPVIVGTIMTGFGLAVGGAAIAGWNVGSLVVEYSLLHHLFYSNADLSRPKIVKDTQADKMKENIEEGEKELPDMEEEKRSSRQERKQRGMVRQRWRLAERVVAAWGAWRVYMNHPVRDAGLALALLFMTVLAFDNYSRAFVYDSGVSETVLGILTAVASLFGIFGSLAFPFLRPRMGVNWTGLLGFGSETLCLSLCVGSVFAPGSPFNPSAIFGASLNTTTTTTTTNPSFVMEDFPEPPYVAGNMSTSPDLVVLNWTLAESLIGPANPTDSTLNLANSSLGTIEKQDTTTNNTNTGDDLAIPPDSQKQDYTFVILLLAGIVTSRFGLWVADLSVTQILQEGVEESQRGAINGVQSSLNQTLDLLRSILIIILPRRETFGILIILSFFFVAAALLMFIVYARRHPAASPSMQTLEAQTEESKVKGRGRGEEERVELKSVRGLESEVV
ncbi:hypothetical protein Pmani_008638 [Petrolisthes manimaculis]|uniref:Solute carrier family 40 protein n=1 Tax=Petrolisthes manimaculis TaxID=1843537 RepID=A0AAE1Q8H8_9EUCA|nr:hypothetical protein Pmani_008638 [Petrolisthes manimaculis]